MATNTHSNKSQLTYAVSYGLFSGPAHGKRLQAAMKKAGYHEVSRQTDADIIIAHSAGCWQVTPGKTTQLIVYVGMPFALERPLKTWYAATSAMLKIMPGSTDKKWLRYVARHNLAFVFRQPLRNWRIIRNAKKPHRLPMGIPSILVINEDDVWTHSPAMETHIQKHDWDFVGLPGSHNDIWQHPDRIVAIINHHAKLLGQTSR